VNQAEAMQALFNEFVSKMPVFNPDWELDRLKINHPHGTFSLPDAMGMPNVEVVILGLVHQRAMFSSDHRGVPCKSPNGEIGIPAASFPWEHSNFNQAQYPEKFSGYRELPCGHCRFKEFDSALDGGKAPACSEQFTLPLFIKVEGGWKLAVFSVQKTGIAPTKKLMTIFQRAAKPCYTEFVRIKLNRVSRGVNFYSTPEYELISPVDPNLYPKLSVFFRAVRHVLTAPPVVDVTGKVVHSEVKYRHTGGFEGLV